LDQVAQQELLMATEQMVGNQFLVAQRLMVEMVELEQLLQVLVELPLQVQV
jgi:hypothetical protein